MIGVVESAAIRFSDTFRPCMWPSVRWTAYAYFKRLFLGWSVMEASPKLSGKSPDVLAEFLQKLMGVEDDWKGMHGDALQTIDKLIIRLNDIIEVVNNGAKPLTAEEHASIQARTEDWAALNLALEERRQSRPGYTKKEEPVDSDDE
ncbi:hypothetical protein ANCCEY_14542 [Ancylostoma ceylanicum]|uniref:Uncharacterized protein n=1 Tax=Ancylostoma ceylanicum TaxID=53326 RepID=A0A0D6L5D6_9BILA|nr:hypothetical protein ANCCEY_14542 [Ancylostoma ceylanicum]